jgi:CubicO group peptidase (beta-lactamase class C family)
MASDAPSLAAWAWQLFAGNIVSAESLNAMMTFDDDGYGLGLEVLYGYGTAAIGHSGSKDGYQSVLAVVPDRQAVNVVFVNRNGALVDLIAAPLLDASRA